MDAPLFSKEGWNEIRRRLAVLGVTELPKLKIPPTAQDVKQKAEELTDLCRLARERDRKRN